MDYAKLRELAEKATPGPWEIGDGCVQSAHDNHPLVTIGQCDEDEGFIAAANPATIISVLDELTQLRAAWTEMRDQFLRERHLREHFERLYDPTATARASEAIEEKCAADAEIEQLRAKLATAERERDEAVRSLADERNQNQTAWQIAAWLDERAAAQAETLASIPDNEHNRESRDEHGWASTYADIWARAIREGKWLTKGDASK